MQGGGLPQILLDHCKHDEIDPSTYELATMKAACAPLHLRLRGDCSLAQVAEAAGPNATVQTVEGMRHCCVVKNAATPVSQWQLFRSGGVYPMNAASAAAVASLKLSPGQHALELCCAPGGKLIAMADAMNMRGTVTGVDVNADRLAVTCRLLQRHGIVARGVSQPAWRCRVLLGDATCALIPPRLPMDAVGFAALDCSSVTRLPTHNSSAGGGSKRSRSPPSSAPASASSSARSGSGYKVLLDSAVENRIRNKALHGPPPAQGDGGVRPGHLPGGDSSGGHSPPSLFDAVLVDAECSHDGSLPHMLKLARQGWQGLGDSTLQPERVAALPSLQGALLRQGWAHLRPGGRLVYSTCSLGQAQNEGVVGAFLKLHPDATLVPAEWKCAEATGQSDTPQVSLKPLQGGLPHTLRFHPVLSGAGGLFVACLEKNEASAQAANSPDSA